MIFVPVTWLLSLSSKPTAVCSALRVWDSANHSSVYPLFLVGLRPWGNQRETTRLQEGEGTCSSPGGWDLLLVPVRLTSAMLIHPFQRQSESRLHFPPYLQKQPHHTPLETPAPSSCTILRGPRSHLHPPPLFPTSRGGGCFP